MLLYIVIREGKQYTCDTCMRIEKLSREKHEVELTISDSQGKWCLDHESMTGLGSWESF